MLYAIIGACVVFGWLIVISIWLYILTIEHNQLGRKHNQLVDVIIVKGDHIYIKNANADHDELPIDNQPTIN